MFWDMMQGEKGLPLNLTQKKAIAYDQFLPFYNEVHSPIIYGKIP